MRIALNHHTVCMLQPRSYLVELFCLSCKKRSVAIRVVLGRQWRISLEVLPENKTQTLSEVDSCVARTKHTKGAMSSRTQNTGIETQRHESFPVGVVTSVRIRALGLQNRSHSHALKYK